MTEDDEWGQLWDARIIGMENFFGAMGDNVLHAPVPFEMGLECGGSPDVVTFSNYTNGTLYVTSNLIGYDGQIPNSTGNYELAVAHSGSQKWGVRIICELAYYTLQTPINDGETMDIGSAIPQGSTISAFLFRQIASFNVLSKPATVICCIGITSSELEYVKKNGAPMLIKKLGEDFVITDLYRKSVI